MSHSLRPVNTVFHALVSAIQATVRHVLVITIRSVSADMSIVRHINTCLTIACIADTSGWITVRQKSSYRNVRKLIKPGQISAHRSVCEEPV